MTTNPENCTIGTKFLLNGEVIYVIKSAEEQIPHESVSTSGKKVRAVLLGEPEHLNAISQRIQELNVKIMYLGNSQGIHKHRKLEKLQKELYQRQAELLFLEKTCGCKDGSQGKNSDEESTTSDLISDTDDLSIVANSGTTTFNHDITDEELVLTKDSFGQIKKLKHIQLSRRTKIWFDPSIRQYFIDGVLHREKEHLKVEWFELFFDLIYVSDALINRFQDLQKQGISSQPAGLMSATLEHSLDQNIVTNTLNLFLSLHLIGAVLIETYFILAVYFTDKRFIASVCLRSFGNSIGLIPYLILLVFYPLDGTTERYTFRLNLWLFSTVAEILAPYVVLLSTPPAFQPKNRVALNIEHIAERHGLLVVIVLGEVVLGLIYNYSGDQPFQGLAYILLAFVISICLFHLYFRAEVESHHQHALRRHWASGLMWTILHIPICVSLVTIAGCVAGLIDAIFAQFSKKNTLVARAESSSKPNGVERQGGALDFEFQVLTATSYAVLLFCLGTLGLLHKHTPKIKENYRIIQNIPRLFILLLRFTFAGIVLIVGLVGSLAAESWLIILGAISFFSVVVEEYGRIHHKKKQSGIN